MSEDAHDVMEGLMSSEEIRELRRATGYAHIDGEIEETAEDSRWCFDTLPGSAQEIAQQTKLAVIKDRTKTRFDLIPWGPVWAMGEVMTNGARKPGRVAHNWRQGTEWSAYFSALMRHVAAYQQGEDFDVEVIDGKEVKQYHLACIMASAAILLEYQMFGLGTDDRFPAGHPAYKGGTK